MAEATVDKRQVSTDALQTLGSIIDENQKRDAIHLAVEPAVAGETVFAGVHVGRLSDGSWGTSAKKKLGIVDPFLKTKVEKGQRFWLVIYPRQITSLQHVWEHPDFPNRFNLEQIERVADRLLGSHEKWIRDYAATVPVHYEDLMEHAADWVRTGDYWCEGGRFEGYYIPAEFWDHYDFVVHVKVPDNKRGNFFTCAC